MNKAQEYEDELVERYREMCGGLSYSSELTLRAGFAAGYGLGRQRGVAQGREQKRCEFVAVMEPDAVGKE